MNTIKQGLAKLQTIKLVEDQINRDLITRNHQHAFQYWTLLVRENDYNRIISFYQANYTCLYDDRLQQGDRLEVVEINENSLRKTGRKCFRFIKSLSTLPTLLIDEDFYSLELSVYPVEQL